MSDLDIIISNTLHMNLSKKEITKLINTL